MGTLAPTCVGDDPTMYKHTHTHKHTLHLPHNMTHPAVDEEREHLVGTLLHTGLQSDIIPTHAPNTRDLIDASLGCKVTAISTIDSS